MNQTPSSTSFTHEGPTTNRTNVALFTTCLIDMFRPSVAFASIELLEALGCDVNVPERQICCGQPAYNNGGSKEIVDIAKNIIDDFEHADFVVVPSGSCAGMIKKHYPSLFNNDTQWLPRAEALASKTYELTQFIVDVLGISYLPEKPGYNGKITIHDSCSGLRELGIKTELRSLLNSNKAVEIVEHSQSEVCCGFGGTFCIKYPEISNQMATKKSNDIISTNADTVTACDLGCLLNIAGKLSRLDSTIEVRHIAELLLEKITMPAIGKSDQNGT